MQINDTTSSVQNLRFGQSFVSTIGCQKLKYFHFVHQVAGTQLVKFPLFNFRVYLLGQPVPATSLSNSVAELSQRAVSAYLKPSRHLFFLPVWISLQHERRNTHHARTFKKQCNLNHSLAQIKRNVGGYFINHSSIYPFPKALAISAREKA